MDCKMGDLSQNELLLLLEEGAITEDDFLLLWSASRRRPQLSPDIGATRFDINSITDERCISLFRFERNDIFNFVEALNIPQKIKCTNNTTASGLEAMCIMLRRFTYPCRLADLVQVFSRSESELSLIFNTVNFIYEHHRHRLQSLNQGWLQPWNIQQFADSVYTLCPLENCWGFMDGTLRPISRPSEHQELVYSGHKRVHGLKFQSVMAPNGMIVNLYGPVEGKRHDAAVLRESGILDELEANMNSNDGRPYSLYGDSAYPLHSHLIGPFKGINLSLDEINFNKQMSSVRQCVEWGFNKIIQNFAFLDFKKNLKLYLQPVAKYYLVAGLMTNCHTCLYGSATGTYFGLQPPTLQDYLS